jgi:hypothetical protein
MPPEINDRNQLKSNKASNGASLRLNAFHLVIPSRDFQIFSQRMPLNRELKPLREKIGDEWFVTWKDGEAYGVPKCVRPKVGFGKPVSLKTTEYLGLSILNAHANEVIPKLLPKYEPIRIRHRRGFRFVAKKVELVDDIIHNWSGVPLAVYGFKIRPRFSCETRLVEMRPGELQILLMLGVAMNWSAESRITDLKAAGVDLTGLHVIRRDPLQGERRLVGRVADIEDDKVLLSESCDETASIAADKVQLEGSRAVFARCLKILLGDRHKEFESLREEHEAGFMTGPGLDNCLDQFFEQFRRSEALELAPGVAATVGDQVSLKNTSVFQTIVQLPAVEYCYDPAKTKRHPYAWEGLEEFGPYSRDSFPKRSPRALVICPDFVQPRVEQALRHMRQGIPQSKFSKGFERTFNLVNVDFAFCTIPLRKVSDGKGNTAHLYYGSVERHLRSDSNFDAAVVVVSDEHAQLPDNLSPYLFSKALLLTNGIPVQEARVSTLVRPKDGLQFIFQNLSVALYAKMGGTPWTVDHDLTVNDEIVIGMGMAELSGSRFEERQRHVGITTVFRGDGNYLLANLSKECAYEEYPQVLKDTMAEVIADIRERNGWRKGDTVRIVFHASKPLRNLEVDELMEKCVKEAAPEQNVQFAFLDVLRDHSFQILDYSQPGRTASDGKIKGKFAPKRGLAAQIGKDTRLICTNGLLQIKRPATPLPVPLLVHLHPLSTGSGCDLTYLTEQILKFTSLTWRSTQPAYTPVTIYYSELIAGLLVRLKRVPGWSSAPLNSKLRSSKWFL